MKNLTSLFIIIIMFLSCNNDDNCPPIDTSCGPNSIIVSESTFNAIENYNYQISNVVLNGNCLAITISSSGCNPDNWSMNLFSTNAFYTVFPLQRVAKIELITNEVCGAVFQKTVSFDLKPFQIAGQNNIPINLQGWNEQINYQY
jgi:hypothetical protein